MYTKRITAILLTQCRIFNQLTLDSITQFKGNYIYNILEKPCQLAALLVI